MGADKHRSSPVELTRPSPRPETSSGTAKTGQQRSASARKAPSEYATTAFQAVPRRD